MADPLDEIVAEGRSKRDQAKDSEARAEQERAREVDRETRSRLAASVSSYASWTWWLCAVAFAIGVGVVAHVGLRDEGDASSGIGFVTGVAALVIAWRLRSTFGRR